MHIINILFILFCDAFFEAVGRQLNMNWILDKNADIVEVKTVKLVYRPNFKREILRQATSSLIITLKRITQLQVKSLKRHKRHPQNLGIKTFHQVLTTFQQAQNRSYTHNILSVQAKAAKIRMHILPCNLGSP